MQLSRVGQVRPQAALSEKNSGHSSCSFLHVHATELVFHSSQQALLGQWFFPQEKGLSQLNQYVRVYLQHLGHSSCELRIGLFRGLCSTGRRRIVRIHVYM